MNHRDDGRGAEEWMDEQLDRALAARPEIQPSTDFVARVMESLPAEPAPASVSHYGRAAAVGSGLVLAALLVISIMAGTRYEPGWLSGLLSLELVLLIVSGGNWRRVLRWPISREG